MDRTPYNPQDAPKVFAEDSWRKASYSAANGTGCVAMAKSADGTIGIGDTKQLDAAALLFDRDEIAGFIQGVKDGEFDYLLA